MNFEFQCCMRQDGSQEWQVCKDLEWVSPLKFCMHDLSASTRVHFWAYKICHFCGVDVEIVVFCVIVDSYPVQTSPLHLFAVKVILLC